MGETRKAKLEGAPQSGTLAQLDTETFVAASRDPDALDALAKDFTGHELELGAYAVARLRFR